MGLAAASAPASFGKLFSCIADGAVYAQPLWAANLTINGAVHNVVFVASAHDSLFAFDADANPCVQLWSVSLIDTAHGATAGGEVTVPAGASGYLVGGGYGDITPEVGVIGTPVIDAASGTLYVVSKSMDPSGTYFYQRLHAIDVTTGHEKASSPILIQGTYPGTGDGTTTTTFSARYENAAHGSRAHQRQRLYRVGGSRGRAATRRQLLRLANGLYIRLLGLHASIRAQRDAECAVMAASGWAAVRPRWTQMDTCT